MRRGDGSVSKSPVANCSFSFLQPRRQGFNIMRNQQTIAELAYAMWHSRGCPDGTPEEDWYAAEQQVATTTDGAQAQVDSLDESLGESFPASDPPASHLPDVPPANAGDQWKTQKPGSAKARA
jgi:hypothetical protein